MPTWLVAAAIAIVTLAAFLPALRNGFVSWDDAKNFVDNPRYRGLGLEQLRWMWTTFHMGHYVPLTWMTLGIDYVLWGMNPAGYHAASLVLHAANAVALFFLARRLFTLASRPGDVDALTTPVPRAFDFPAAVAALVFAVHPLRVESVAWVTERRDVLSLLFFQLAVLAYLRWCAPTPTRRRWYWLSVLLFICALLSKATAMTLPAILVLLNVYPLRRLDLAAWRERSARVVIAEIIPFALLTSGVVVLSIVALHPPEQLGLPAKLAVSAYGFVFYLWKTVAPARLSPLYEMPRAVDPLEARFVLAYLACAAIAFGMWHWRRRWTGSVACLAAFVVTVLPMLGIVQNGPQIAADRYTYHASPAIGLLAGAAMFAAAPLAAPARRWLAAATIAVLSILTWRQTMVWHDSERLWAHALSIEPNSAIASSAMASIRYRQNRVAEGMELSQRAVTLAPDYAEAHNDVGVGLAQQGQLDAAAESYRKAIALRPDYDEALNNLGVILVQQGDIAGGTALYQRALQANPDYADAHTNWGNALVRAGQREEAIGHYRLALEIRPGDADAHFNWGVALAQQGKYAEAAGHFRRTLDANPDHAEAKDYLDRTVRLMSR